MTTIKASCPVCGDVELTPPQVRLVVCNIPSWSRYSFTCPTCHDLVSKPATSDVVQLLSSGGVPAEDFIVPAEALEDHDGTGLTWDDVLDFALALDSGDFLAAAAGPTVLPGSQKQPRTKR